MGGGPIHVGKESNSIETRMRGEVSREDDYLNRYEPRLCGCGCGEAVSGRRGYVDGAHKQEAWRCRHASSMQTSGVAAHVAGDSGTRPGFRRRRSRQGPG